LSIWDGAELLSATPEELNSIFDGEVYVLHRVAAWRLSRTLHSPGSAFVLYLSFSLRSLSLVSLCFPLIGPFLLQFVLQSPCLCASTSGTRTSLNGPAGKGYRSPRGLPRRHRLCDRASFWSVAFFCAVHTFIITHHSLLLYM
jgi:hypothetical protein